jgi:hypothetical protein
LGGFFGGEFSVSLWEATPFFFFLFFWREKKNPGGLFDAQGLSFSVHFFSTPFPEFQF